MDHQNSLINVPPSGPFGDGPLTSIASNLTANSNFSLIGLLREAFLNQQASAIRNLMTLQRNHMSISPSNLHLLQISNVSEHIHQRKRKKLMENDPLHHFKDHWGLKAMNLAQLKQICKSLNLSVSGRKDDLIHVRC
jgi:hypothetical protein